MRVCAQLAVVLFHAVLVAGCAPPAPAAPSPAARDASRPWVRRSRAFCEGSPCWVSVALEGTRQAWSGDVFDAMHVLTERAFDMATLERDLLVLAALYYDRGYLGARIDPPEVDYRREEPETEVRIRVSIDEGPQYRIKRLEVYEDRGDLRCAPIGGWSSPLRPGDVFDRATLMGDLQRVQRTYRDKGYADVTAVPATKLDPDRHEVSIQIPVTRGAVQSFGRFFVRPHPPATPADLRPWLDVVEGARYSETALARSKARLLESGHYSRVDVSTEKGKAPRTLDVIFDLTEGMPPPEPQGHAAPTAAEEPPDTQACHALPLPREIGARHVLVSYAGSKAALASVTRSRDEARKRAGEALQRLRGGARFEDVVKEYTDEPGGRERVGDLGVFDRDAMVDAFSDAAFGLRVGDVSEVVETGYGFHVIQRTR